MPFPTIRTRPENGKNARSLPHHDGGKRRTREDGLSAPFRVSFRKYLTFLVLIRKTTLGGGMGREMEGRFGREGIWVYLWLILADV